MSSVFRGFALSSSHPVARLQRFRSRFTATTQRASRQYIAFAATHSHDSQLKDEEQHSIISRRMALNRLFAAAFLMGSPAFADEQAETSSEQAKTQDESPSTSYVSEFPDDGVASSLRPNEYYKQLLLLRPICWAAMARSLQSKEYDRLSLAMNQAPIADLRAAAKFTPWALLQADEYEAAVASRKAFVDLEVHMKDLQQIAEATAMDGATPEQVQQAFILLNASFEQFIATIPSRFQ